MKTNPNPGEPMSLIRWAVIYPRENTLRHAPLFPARKYAEIHARAVGPNARVAKVQIVEVIEDAK